MTQARFTCQCLGYMRPPISSLTNNRKTFEFLEKTSYAKTSCLYSGPLQQELLRNT